MVMGTKTYIARLTLPDKFRTRTSSFRLPRLSELTTNFERALDGAILVGGDLVNNASREVFDGS
jgi:hypothetical protein